MLHFALRKRKAVIGIALIVFAGSLFLFTRLGGEFIPILDEGDFAVETRVLKGSSISQTIESSLRAARLLRDNFPEVKEVIGKIGSSEIPTDPMPIEACDLIVILKDKSEWTSAKSREELADKMSAVLKDLPGVTFSFQQPIQMRFNELMTGARQDVVIKIYGEDLDRLSSYAGKVGRIASGIKGAQDVFVEPVTGQPQIVVHLDREKIAQFGLNIEDINRGIRTGFAGEAVGFVYEGEKRFDLVVRLAEEKRGELDDIRNIFIASADGKQVPLAQVADVSLEMSVNQVQRDDAKRRVMVGFNVRGRDVETVVKEMEAAIAKQVTFEPGYYPTFGGTFKNLIEARQRLTVAVPVALLLILVLLFFSFRSLKQSLLIFTAIPFSAIGGILALWIRGMPFSISAGVGFIALFGVAVLNGIVLIAEFNRLKKEGMKDIQQIILTATSARLRPVIMTALVASLGFLPMALSHGSGAEVQRPLATVVIGGLVTATLLTLLVIPVLYWLMEQGSRKNKSALSPMLLFICFLPTLADAQQPMLSMNEAVTIALKNNLGLRAAIEDLEQSKAISRTSLDLDKTNISFMSGQYNSQYNDKSITISQSIPFPILFEAKRKLNEAGVNAGELQLKITENELAFQVKSAYRKLQILSALDELFRKEDSIYNGVTKAGSARFRAGESNLLDKTNLETQALEIKNKQLKNRSDILITLSQLKALLNRTTEFVSEALPLSREDWSPVTDSAAIGANPNVLLNKQQAEIQRLNWRLEQAKAWPDIHLSYFNQSLTGYQNVYGTDEYFGPSKRFTGFTIGLALPLWYKPFGARIKAASFGKSAAEFRSQYFRTQMAEQASQEVQAFLQLKNTLTFYERSALPNAERVISQAGKALALGEIGYPEYLQSLKNSLGIRESYLGYIHQYYQSIIKIEFLYGKK